MMTVTVSVFAYFLWYKPKFSKYPPGHSFTTKNIDRNDAAFVRMKQKSISINDFAKANKLNNWAENFDGARKFLDNDESDSGYVNSAVFDCENINPHILRLLGAAGASDVFGGMGSWNDQGFSSDKEYQRTSSNLYKTMCQSIAVAINAI